MPKGISANARNDALANGQQTYLGQACIAGHTGERYVTNRACVECARSGSRLNYSTEGARLMKARYRARLKADSSKATDLGSALLESI